MRIDGEVLDSRGKPGVKTVNNDPSETVQSDAHLTDIHNIMAQFGEGGHVGLDEAALLYADVSEFTDLQDAMKQAHYAEKEFLKLPSKVREVFGHDVAVWLDTAHDEDKRDELVKAGFLEPREEKSQKVVAEASQGGAGSASAKTGEGDPDKGSE